MRNSSHRTGRGCRSVHLHSLGFTMRFSASSRSESFVRCIRFSEANLSAKVCLQNALPQAFACRKRSSMNIWNAFFWTWMVCLDLMVWIRFLSGPAFLPGLPNPYFSDRALWGAFFVRRAHSAVPGELGFEFVQGLGPDRRSPARHRIPPSALRALRGPAGAGARWPRRCPGCRARGCARSSSAKAAV